MGTVVDLVGKRFGRLVVIRRDGRDKFNNATWLCKCDCGKEKVISASPLKRGNVKSCGCLNSELSRARKQKHNMSRTPIYHVWCNTRRRQYGTNITIAECWKNDFQSFYDYVSKLPHYGEDGYTLDRIDTNGIYEPGNVRWANSITQANNKTKNHLITFNGKTQTMAQWAREKGIRYATLEMRLNRRGWSVERALTTPVKAIKPHKQGANPK